MERIRLIALDMDGTLLAADHFTVPQRNIEAICEAHALGIRVCICTGRMLEDASEFCKRLKLPCAIIGCNGTRAADAPVPEGQILLRHNLAPDDAKALLDYLMPKELMINVFEDGLVSTRQTNRGEVYHLVKRGVLPARYGEEAVRKAAGRGIMKVFAISPEHPDEVSRLREEIRRAFPALQVTNSSPVNIEIMPASAGKGNALAALAAFYGLTREQVMAVGDAENDLSMLEYAYHSVAMGNAEQSIKQVCRYVTADNDQCGVADIIECVIRAVKAHNE